MNIHYDGTDYKLYHTNQSYVGPVFFADKHSALKYVEALLLSGGNVSAAVEKIGLVLHEHKEVAIKESRFIEDLVAYKPIFKIKTRRRVK